MGCGALWHEAPSMQRASTAVRRGDRFTICGVALSLVGKRLEQGCLGEKTTETSARFRHTLAEEGRTPASFGVAIQRVLLVVGTRGTYASCHVGDILVECEQGPHALILCVCSSLLNCSLFPSTSSTRSVRADPSSWRGTSSAVTNLETCYTHEWMVSTSSHARHRVPRHGAESRDTVAFRWYCLPNAATKNVTPSRAGTACVLMYCTPPPKFVDGVLRKVL